VRESYRSGTSPEVLSTEFFAVLDGEQHIELREWVAGRLTSVLKRRGLTSAPGALLGHDGYATLLPRSGGDPDDCALHDLTQDLMVTVFGTRRLVSLLRSSEDPAWDPDVMVRLMAKNYVHDLQRRGDPLGAAIYDGLQRAAQLEEARDWVQASGECLVLARQEASLSLLRDEEPGIEEIRAAFGSAGALDELRAKAAAYFGGSEEPDGEPRRVHLRSRTIDLQLLSGLAALRGAVVVTIPVSRLVEALRAELPDGRPGHVGGAAELLLEMLPSRLAEPSLREGSSFLERLRRALEGANLRPKVRERLLRILHAIAQAVEDGTDPHDAVRQLGIPKQTLSDAMARLRELAARLLTEDGPPGISG